MAPIPAGAQSSAPSVSVPPPVVGGEAPLSTAPVISVAPLSPGASVRPPPPPVQAQDAPIANPQIGAVVEPGPDEMADMAAERQIERWIAPASLSLVDALKRLQNNVLRACTVGNPDLVQKAAFADAVGAAATIQTLAFGASAAAFVAEGLFTEASETVFGRSQLDGIIRGRIIPPSTLRDLRRADRALTGLPALEVLLLAGPRETASQFANRCRFAELVVANLVDRAFVFRRNWADEDLREAHWTSEPPELANRLRLRDLIQSTINVFDDLDLDIARFMDDPSGNTALPFASPQMMRHMIVSTLWALKRQADWLTTLADPENADALELLAIIEADANEAMMVAAAGGDIDPAPYARLRRQIYRELPEAFGFADAAFNTPIGAFAPRQAR